MEDSWDNPLDNPMYFGPLGDLKAYLAPGEEEEDLNLILSDPTGLCLGGSPKPLLEAVFEADLRRLARRARRRPEPAPPTEE